MIFSFPFVAMMENIVIVFFLGRYLDCSKYALVYTEQIEI